MARGWQKIEGAAVLAAMVLILWIGGTGGLAWWAVLLVFFAPDLSFAAYLFGPRIGAMGYNVVHVYGFGALVAALGLAAGLPWLTACGWLWLGHAGMDRLFGYGLKLPGGFKETHLGPL